MKYAILCLKLEFAISKILSLVFVNSDSATIRPMEADEKKRVQVFNNSNRLIFQ